jgi:hypothetical protein
MRVTITDPITGNDVNGCEGAPFVIEGEGEGALKIYFESERNKREFLEISTRTPGACSITLYRQIEDNETILWD